MATAVTSLAGALQEARDRTLALVAPFSYAELERVQHRLMSPLCWDLGHIAAYEDLWLVHRHGGEQLLRGDLSDLDAPSRPRAPCAAARTRKSLSTVRCTRSRVAG